MIKNTLLVLVFLFVLVPTAQAFNPPPGGSHFFKLPPPPPRPDPCSPPDPRCSRLFNPYIKIELPPRLIFTPDQLLFPEGGVTYNFIDDEFVPNGQQYLRHRVETKLEGSGDGAYYVITIFGFVRGELPDVKDFRLTFKEPVTKSSVEKVEDYLTNPLNFVPTARLTGSDCQTPLQNPKSHICLDTITTVRGQTTRLPSAHVRQTISVRGTFVPGNVAAPREISGFSLGASSLAVGGSIDVDGGTKLQQYLASPTIISWSSISNTLNGLFNKGTLLGTSMDTQGFNGKQYTPNNWNLNASFADPVVGTSSSFSFPPEGKIWKVIATDPNFNIGNGNGVTTFSGSGTIVFTGDQDINLIFKQPVACSPGTRLAFITKGNITFEARASDGYKVSVGCGAYISLNGNIDFAPSTVKEGDLKGIFVAKNNIILPDSENLTGSFIIDRDDLFASNPTSLLRELLKLVFTPS